MSITISNTFLSTKLVNNIIFFTVLKGSPSDEEWYDCEQIVNKWYDYLETNNIKAGLLFSLENLIFIRPKLLVDWKRIFEEKRILTKKYIIATSIIIDNVIIRTFINLFFKTYNSEKPVRIVRTIEDGENFIYTHISR